MKHFLIILILRAFPLLAELPDYVIINQTFDAEKILTQPCEPISFPLSDEDRHIIATLEAKFDQEENCAGLAAPQIGFKKTSYRICSW